MNNFVTDAINLKSYNLSESDKIVVMYSREKGLIKGVAKGVKKPKSKLGARMDLLVANKLMLFKGKSMDRICQADVLNTFNKTRRDMDKIFYSMYVSEVVNSFGVEDDPCSNETYDLLYKTLEHISEANSKTEMLLACLKFQLKMMQIAGFGIELDTCLCCREAITDDNMYFSSNMGGVICSHCNETFNVKTSMHKKIRDFLNTLVQIDFDQKTSYDEKVNEKVCTVCFNLLKDYINGHSSKKIHSAEVLL